MDERTLQIQDENGNQKEMEIILTFDSDELKKSFVIFTDPSIDDGEVYAMSYDEEGNLYALESDEEFNIVSEVFEAFQNEEEE